MVSVFCQINMSSLSISLFYTQQHIVMYNTKYADVSEAADQSDGLAVIGVMFKVGYNAI